jgi:hypothetical protein
MLFTEASNCYPGSKKVLILSMPALRCNRKSLGFSGSKRRVLNLTSHINTVVVRPSSVILRSSTTANVEQFGLAGPQTLLFR